MPGVTVAAKPATFLSTCWQAALDDHVQALAWSPEGQLLAAAAVSGPISLFDTASGLPIQLLPGHGFGTSALAWHPNGTLLASGGQDGKARSWDPGSGEERAALAAGAAWVEQVAWSPGGKYLATAAGRKIRLWSAAGELVREYPEQPSTVTDLKWKPGRPILASSAYAVLRLWSPSSDQERRRFEWQGSTLVLAWSPDGKYLATGDQDSTVHFWIVKTGRDLQMWGYLSKVRELAWDPNSRFLATGGGPEVVVWDCSGKGPAGSTPTMLKAHGAHVSTLSWQSRGPLLASGAGDGRVLIWNPAGRKRPVAEAELESAISQVAWSPDDRLLATGTAAGAVEVFASPTAAGRRR